MADSKRDELAWVSNPDLPSLRRAVRHALLSSRSGLRIVAEGFLAADTPIDLLGVSEYGELVSVRIAQADDSARALTAILSDLAWLAARAEDLQKLAPDLDLAPGAGAVGILLSSEFGTETRLAITQLPANRVQTIRYQSYRQHAQTRVQLWPASSPPHTAEAPAHERAGSSREPAGVAPGFASPTAATPVDRPPSPTRAVADDLAATTGFRTGLTDADLHLEARALEEGADEFASSPTSLSP